jgi:hypothetical protein
LGVDEGFTVGTEVTALVGIELGVVVGMTVGSTDGTTEGKTDGRYLQHNTSTVSVLGLLMHPSRNKPPFSTTFALNVQFDLP